MSLWDLCLVFTSYEQLMMGLSLSSRCLLRAEMRWGQKRAVGCRGRDGTAGYANETEWFAIARWWDKPTPVIVISRILSWKLLNYIFTFSLTMDGWHIWMGIEWFLNLTFINLRFQYYRNDFCNSVFSKYFNFARNSWQIMEQEKGVCYGYYIYIYL